MPGQRHIRLFTEPPKRQSDWENVEKDMEDALRRNVREVEVKIGEMAGQGGRESIYLGDVGVAFMEISIAQVRRGLLSEPEEDGDVLSSDALLSLSDARLLSSIHEPALNPHHIRNGAHLSFLETPIGVATLVLSKYPLGRNQRFVNAPWEMCRDLLLRGVEVIVNDDRSFGGDDDGCEVLYGRAGFLYALLFLRNAFASREGGGVERGDGDLDRDIESCRALISDEAVQTVVDSIIRRGRNGARSYRSESGPANSPPLMWVWHMKRYLGGAHGVAGILHMLLNCPFSIISSYIPEIVQTIDWLVDAQDRVGNWPTRAADPDQTTSGENDLVQWCHGAPAMLILLSTILRMSVTPGNTTGLTDKQQERFVLSLQRGCARVYMQGFLRKGVGLCHGVAGSVYALLSASSILDEPPSNVSSGTSSVPPQEHYTPYFTQAAHLAHQATFANSLTRKGEMRTPDHPNSLYEGTAGMCCAWQEILYRLKHRDRSFLCSGMPGYDDLYRLTR